MLSSNEQYYSDFFPRYQMQGTDDPPPAPEPPPPPPPSQEAPWSDKEKPEEKKK